MRPKSDPRGAIQLPAGCLYAGTSAGIAFLSLFVVAGAVGVYFCSVEPAVRSYLARDWTAVPCEIVESRLDDGEARIVYRYEVGAQVLQGDRFGFRPAGARGAPPAAVEDYPAGSRTRCFVDPADPAQAVLDRGVRRELWIGLFPGVFLAIGGIGIAIAVSALRHIGGRERARRDLSAGAAALAPSAPAPHPVAGGGRGPIPRGAELGRHRVFQAGGLWLIALFWNGITGAVGGGMVWAALQGGEGIAALGCGGLFLVPFVLIGGVILVAAVRSTLQVFGPRPLVVLPKVVALGERFLVRWEITGRVSRLRRLRVELVGREEASYSVGTSRSTDRREFHCAVLFESETHLEHGEATAAVPPGSMHSFTSANNKIVWAVRFKGDVPHWPDVDDELVLEVAPRSGGRP